MGRLEDSNVQGDKQLEKSQGQTGRPGKLQPITDETKPIGGHGRLPPQCIPHERSSRGRPGVLPTINGAVAVSQPGLTGPGDWQRKATGLTA